MSSIKKNFFYNSLLSVSRILFPLISFPYSSRILGPEGIGKVNFIDSYSQYFCILAALGIPMYGVREVAKSKHNPEALGKLTSELMIINFIGAVFWCFIYFAIAIWTNKYEIYSHLYILGAISLLLSAFPVEWFFQGTEKFKYVSTRSFFLNIFSLILLFAIVKKPADYYWYYGITIITLGLNVVINLSQLLKATQLTIKGLSFKPHIKPLAYLFSTQIAISVYVILDKVILGYMAEDVYLGYYASSLKIVKVLLTLITALSIVLVPQMSKAFKEGDIEKVQRLYKKSTSFVFTIGIAMSAGLICLSEEIISILTGPAFLPAAVSLQLMAPIIFLIGLNNIFGVQILTANGKEKLLLRCVLIGTVVNVGLNLLLIPFLLHNGASIAILATELFVTVLTGYYACKEIKMRFNWSQLLLTCLICLPFWGIHALVKSDNLGVTIALTCIICSVYYFIVEVFLVKEEVWVENYIKFKNKINARF